MSENTYPGEEEQIKYWNKKEAEELARIEEEYTDQEDRDDLIDDGRSDGEGESYAERNI